MLHFENVQSLCLLFQGREKEYFKINEEKKRERERMGAALGGKEEGKQK
jgi:hypothetical protein